MDDAPVHMTVTTHQPIFLPWPGFFFKAARSDCMVLLDRVQYPRGRSWMNRNRLKNEEGTLWLTVPVRKKGRGLQSIREAEIYDELSWRHKHLRGIQQNYVRSPYFEEHYEALGSIYNGGQTMLAEFNIDLIRYLWKALPVEADLILQSELGVEGTGTDLLASVCERLGADRLALFPAAAKFIDAGELLRRGIEPRWIAYRPPVYPQLWGEFIHNLSVVDLLMNCGPMSSRIIAGKGGGEAGPSRGGLSSGTR